MAFNKEDDQLLQDASTLLMFANVAAKQQHQGPPPLPLQVHLQPPQPPTRSLLSEGSYGAAQSPAMQINNMILPFQPQPPHDQLPPHMPPHQSSLYQRNRPILHQIPHGAIPSHSQVLIQLPQSPPPTFQPLNSSHMPQRLPPASSYDHEYHHPQNFAHTERYIAPEQYAILDLLHVPSLGVQSRRTVPFTPAHPRLPPPVTSRVPSRRSSQSSIPHILNSEGPSHSGAASSKILMASLLEPPISNVNSGMQRSESAKNQARLISPPNVQGMHGEDLPTPYHRRSVSNPHVDLSLTRPIAKNLAKFSPMQGININTHVRNTSNAMIAAAALAAAAEVPLPLKTTPSDTVLGDPLEDRVKSAPKPSAPKATTGGKRKANKNLGVGAKTPLEPGTVSQPPPPLDSKPPLVPPHVPSLESYKVDPDSGAIGCICELADDDGYTIQCDICFRWQHCLCMGFKTSDEVPEAEYRCYYCDPKKWGRIDAEKCRAETLARLDRDRTEKEAKEIMQSNLKRKASTSEKPERKKRAENGITSSDKVQGPLNPGVIEVEPSIVDNLPNKDNELLTDGVTAEAYESVYFRTKINDYKTPEIKATFETWGEKVRELYESLPKAQQKKPIGGVEVMSMAQFKALKLSRLILPNHGKYLESHKANAPKKGKFNKTAIHVGPYSENQKQKFGGFSKLALIMTSDVGETTEVPTGTTVIEYVGELDILLNYAADNTNQFSLWGTTKPRVADSCIQTGIDSLDIVLDSRFVGNEARFIRKACHNASNCALKVVYIPESNLFKFLVVTTRPISFLPSKAEEELRLDWKWASTHPINKVSEAGQCKFDQLEDSEKAALISCVDNILHFTECGCSTSNANLSCSIFKVKKATSYLLRSTRKASGISTVNLMRPKDELVIVLSKYSHVLWDQRLLERARLIDMRLTVSTETISELDPVDDADDVKSSKENHTVRPAVYFKVPFRRQIPTKKHALISPESETSEISFLPNLNEELPFEVLPEVSRKIDEMIDAKLQSDAKIAPPDPKSGTTGIVSPGIATGLTSAEPPIVLVSGETSKAPSMSVAPSETNDPSSSSTGPLVESPKVNSPKVKKLSFADYKRKKM